MNQRAPRLTGMAATWSAVLALGACSGGQPGDAVAGEGGEPAFVRAHTIQQLMADVVQPTADIYWRSVQFVSDETGEHDIRPETDAQWLATRTAAASLTEYGNLLMTPLYAEGRGEDWMDFSRGLVEIGMQAEQAAIARDPDKVFEVGGTLYNVCTGCHQLYPPLEAPAEAAAPAQAIRPAAGVPLDQHQDQAGE